ncbi:caspase family protein [Streptomyces olivaceus]
MTNRALLIGINNYAKPGNRLNSCVADTRAFRDLLGGFGFTDTDVRFLHDEAATLANVQEGLDWLFEAAAEGDHRVFFQSSHGSCVQRPDGTRAEVLCLYGFDGYQEYLGDHELSLRTQHLPPGVLTVVVDACHSGGMDKLFFLDDEPQIARSKVFDLGADDRSAAAKEAVFGPQAPALVKFFGRSAAGDLRSVVKNFAAAPEVPPTSDTVAGDVEINGLLFTACRADQTAAAGSTATNGLSAFTFAVMELQDPTQSVDTLCRRVTDLLGGLHLAQTPTAFARPDQRQLLERTFVSGQPAAYPGAGGAVQKAPALLPPQYHPTTHTQKEYTTMATTVSEAVTAVLTPLSAHAGAASVKAFSGQGTAYQNDVTACVNAIAPALAVVAARPAAQKGIEAPLTINNPRDLQDKGFWDDVWNNVGKVADVVIDVGGKVLPVVINALTQEPAAPGKKEMDTDAVAARLAQDIPPRRVGDQQFWNTAHSALQTLAPAVIDMAEGRPHSAQFPPIPAGRADDKDWTSDLLSVVRTALPVVLSLL